MPQRPRPGGAKRRFQASKRPLNKRSFLRGLFSVSLFGCANPHFVRSIFETQSPRMNSSLSFAKAWFALSVLVLAFGYGFASHAGGLFPKTFVEQAWRQTRAFITSEPPSVPRVYDRSGARVLERKRMQPGGAVLVTSSWHWEESGSLEPGAKLISRSGETLHSWHPDRSELFQGPGLKGKDPQKVNYHGPYLFPNGDLLLNLSRVGLVRLNSCGRVLWRLKEGNHHSIARTEDGSFWTPGTSSETREGTSQYPDGFPGIDKEI